MKLFRYLIVCTAIGILTACASAESSMNHATPVSDDKDLIELDYSKLDEAVRQVLNENPDFTPQSTVVNVQDINDMPLTSFFDRDKTKFRLKVERILAGMDYIDSDIKANAQKVIDEQIALLDMAEKEHGITVSQEEVTKFIEENVINAQLDSMNANEKSQYSVAIGISSTELDMSFDRDFYIMDVLYTKLNEHLGDGADY